MVGQLLIWRRDRVVSGMKQISACRLPAVLPANKPSLLLTRVKVGPGSLFSGTVAVGSAPAGITFVSGSSVASGASRPSDDTGKGRGGCSSPAPCLPDSCLPEPSCSSDSCLPEPCCLSDSCLPEPSCSSD